MKTMTQNTMWSMLLLAALVVGCSDRQTADIHGRVTLDGKPVKSGTIRFVPVDGQGPTASAIVENGAYSVTVQLGAKEVEIRAFETIGTDRPWGKEGPAVDRRRQILPTRYNTDTELTCEIADSDGNCDFAVESH